MKKKQYIFQVKIMYIDNSSARQNIKAADDVAARAKAIALDDLGIKVAYCEIVKVCTIDGEE